MLRFSGFKGSLEGVKKDIEMKLTSMGIDTNQLQRNYLKELNNQTKAEESTPTETETNVSDQDYHTLATQSESFTPATPRLQLSRHKQVVPEKTETQPEPVTSFEPAYQPQNKNTTQSQSAKSAAEERAFRAGIEAHKRALALKEQEEIQRLEAAESEKRQSNEKKRSIWNFFN